MRKSFLKIGRWRVDFLFCTEVYEKEEILPLLSYMDASDEVLDLTEDIIDSDILNTGFTYSNTKLHRALVVIGPSSSGAEFVDSLTHELHHVAVAIADSIGVDLDSETPAYIAGDAARDLISIICDLGCDRCNGKRSKRRKV